MPEGTFCNKIPIKTEEALKALLGDTGGKQYYEEMKALDVDSDLLWKTITKIKPCFMLVLNVMIVLFTGRKGEFLYTVFNVFSPID